jgi:hypothetical protein
VQRLDHVVGRADDRGVFGDLLLQGVVVFQPGGRNTLTEIGDGFMLSGLRP